MLPFLHSKKGFLVSGFCGVWDSLSYIVGCFLLPLDAQTADERRHLFTGMEVKMVQKCN